MSEGRVSSLAVATINQPGQAGSQILSLLLWIQQRLAARAAGTRPHARLQTYPNGVSERSLIVFRLTASGAFASLWRGAKVGDCAIRFCREEFQTLPLKKV
jgi:hypothetical protein